jgi:hypothetical protein
MSEKTSKKVAAKSGRMLANGEVLIAQAKRIQREMHEFIEFFEVAMSSAGSALTQREKEKE